MIVIKESSYGEIQEMLEQGKKIIAFCAGQALCDLCNAYDWVNHIEYVVDNYKKNSNIMIQNCNIPIISVEEAGKNMDDHILLITSMQYIDELICQLDSMAIYDERIFYVSGLLKKKEESKDICLGQHKQMIIPKKIHYCWFGKSEMPEKFKRNVETWKENCPDYEIIRWDESTYDIAKNQYMYQAYQAKRWGFVPDYARLDIVYTYGGVYLDTDVELLRSIDELLKAEFFCGFESEKYIALGLGFGARAGNKILEEMLQTYEKLEFVKEDGALNLIASPFYQTEVMERFGLKRNGCTQMNDRFLALSSEYLSPINEVGIGRPTPYSYSIHQYAATWFDEEQQEKKNRLMNNYRLVLKRMTR